MKLTIREQDIYNFIFDYWHENGFSPSVRDIASSCYISVTSAHNYILKLYDKGFITFVPKVARSIVLKE